MLLFLSMMRWTNPSQPTSSKLKVESKKFCFFEFFFSISEWDWSSSSESSSSEDEWEKEHKQGKKTLCSGKLIQLRSFSVPRYKRGGKWVRTGGVSED